MKLIFDEFTRGTVSAIATLAESREPSAAGHQRRVALISVAIAVELKLDADAVDDVRLAGELHDIGKIGFPSEILTQTRRLTLPEWELIKTHCQIGYGIIVGMNSGWRMAEMVLQHHERCDGSGYPAGLHGDEIVLGARIIAVADTIEDEVSHAISGTEDALEAALDKVQEGSGTLFDSHVVTACLRLFREGRLSLLPEVLGDAGW